MHGNEPIINPILRVNGFTIPVVPQAKYLSVLFGISRSFLTFQTFSSPYQCAVPIAHFWKEVQNRLIDIIFTLASSNISFRSHREFIGENNNGNYLSIVELLSKYDPILSKPNDKNNSLKIIWERKIVLSVIVHTFYVIDTKGFVIKSVLNTK